METDENSRGIVISEDENFTKIEVKKPGSLFYFYNEIISKLPKHIYEQVNMSYIYNKLTMVNKGTLYILENKDRVYNIFINNNDYEEINLSKLAITEKINTSDECTETTLELLSDNKYKLTTKTNSLSKINDNTKIFINDEKLLNEYISDRANIRNSSQYILTKKSSLVTITSLLDNLSKLDGIDKLIDLEDVYNYLGVVSINKFNPIITDDHLTISKDADDDMCTDYSIVRNNTREIIGNIKFDNRSYDYRIKKEYEDNNFNIRSLKLLEKLVNNDKNPQKLLSKNKNHS